MNRRLFVAILIPEEIKKKLASLVEKFKNSSSPFAFGTKTKGSRFLRSDNFHSTLAFIGGIDESMIGRIIEAIKAAAENQRSFVLNLRRIVLGPDSKRPRMIWAVGEKSPEIEKTWKDLREKLKENGIPFDDKYPLKVHLTLARARGREFFGKKVDEEINISFPVNGISLVESRLKPEGAEYNILESFHFPK